MSKCQFQKIQKVRKFFKKSQKVKKCFKKIQKVRKFIKKIQKVNLALSAFRLLRLAGGLGLGRRATTQGRSLAADDLELKLL